MLSHADQKLVHMVEMDTLVVVEAPTNAEAVADSKKIVGNKAEEEALDKTEVAALLVVPLEAVVPLNPRMHERPCYRPSESRFSNGIPLQFSTISTL